MPGETSPRANQLKRTRGDLVKAAARLLRQGRTPNLEEVAAEALVSRATAYRHFPVVEAVLAEAALEMDFPDAAALFADGERDVAARVHRTDQAVVRMTRANEAAFRLMLSHGLRAAPAPRGNRRTPLIEAALAPVLDGLDEGARTRLIAALALIIGPEALIVFKDVLQLDDDRADAVRAWMIDTLLAATHRSKKAD